MEEEELTQPLTADMDPPPSSSPRSGGGGGRAPVRSHRSKGQLEARGMLTDDQINIVLADLASEGQVTLLGAGTGQGTWSRYLVEKYLSKWKWYNPQRDDPDAPALSKGWAYFEYFTLPRRFDRENDAYDVRAPPGEVAQRTRLYRVFATTRESLSDWGIGVGMYFSTLYATFAIFVLAGCLNIPNILYYGSDAYDPGPGMLTMSLNALLQYSVICTDREWVVCAEPEGASETCRSEERYWDNIFTRQYYQTTTDANGDEVTLINRTTCLPAEFVHGMINYGTLMMLILLLSFFMWWLSKREVRFDEDNSSASDYSLVVHNPPPDAVDPDEWRDFFEVFAEKGVTLVTVALNNELLLEKLVQRRKDLRTLSRRLPKGTNIDTNDVEAMDAIVEKSNNDREDKEAQRNCLIKLLLCPVTALMRRLGKGLPETVIWDRIKATTEEIRELQQREYAAAAVFVTFETEQGQRTALEALNASEIEVMTNKPISLDNMALFRGRVLRVVEATEPNSVRWKDLNYFQLSVYLRQLMTLGITCVLVGVSAVILWLSRLRVSTLFFSIILSLFNSIIPIIVKLIMSFEKHYREDDVQKSLYVKITLFRWVNTVIVTRWITPSLAVLGSEKIDLINTVNALMISEMLISPLLRYLDLASMVKKHYNAPRAKTEEELFNCFDGGVYNLAERFTDYTKVLFVCIFYSAFYPLVYFLGAGILFLQYWTDKFLLLRAWYRAPIIGPETSRFSRIYFNSLAILLGVISSAYAYTKSPYTMLCNCAQNGEEWENNKKCTRPDIDSKNVDVDISDELFYFCDQDVNKFPPLPSVQGPDKWMDGGQEQLSSIYGVTCIVFLILYCVVVLGSSIVRALQSVFRGTYQPSGYNQYKDFSNGIGLETFGYVPQLAVPGFNFPLIISNIDDIDVGLIGWRDPNIQNEVDEHFNYDKHNLIFDVPHETLHRSRNTAADPSEKKPGRPIFSIIKHYPPEWARRAKANGQN